MVVPKGSELAFMKQAPKMGQYAWQVLENRSTKLAPKSWVDGGEIVDRGEGENSPTQSDSVHNVEDGRGEEGDV